MIIRERANDFIMIEQDNHAQISGALIINWKSMYFLGEQYRNAVAYAIYKHDVGWKAFDKQPFWNDRKQAPYSFVDFPTPAKVILYTHGIDAVEAQDPYAALLCSEHYTRFLLKDTSEEAKAFVKQEKMRQQQIIETLTHFDQPLFNFHYGLLQLCDNLSLYMCLNEPNIAQENEHPFFRDGIPLDPALKVFHKNKITLRWKNEHTIAIDEFPLHKTLTMTIKQKAILKDTIEEKGLIEAYRKAPSHLIDIRLTAEAQ